MEEGEEEGASEGHSERVSYCYGGRGGCVSLGICTPSSFLAASITVRRYCQCHQRCAWDSSFEVTRPPAC